MKRKWVRPVAATLDLETRLSNLVFAENSRVPSGQYRMRGGITFPMIAKVDGMQSIKGFAVMCARDEKTGTIYLMEQFEFVSIEHILDQNKVEVKFAGIGNWFMDMWRVYYGNTFFYNQRFEVGRKYRNQILRSPLVTPKPKFLESPVDDKDQALHSVFEADMLGRLKYPDGKVYLDMKENQANPDNDYIALNAFTCAINGLNKYKLRN